MTPFLNTATRYLFFAGKGGVGKTSLACAAAVALVDQGKFVLLVSTDPASNLDAVLEESLSASPTPITAVPELHALNIDPQEAAREYRQRVLSPYQGSLSKAEVASLEEQLSGACTVEVAAFDAFTSLLSDKGKTAGFDHVIFDTAPTGHTLRLLELPAAWTNFLGHSKQDISCVGPLSGLQSQQPQYDAAVTALADPHQTTLVLVTRPERGALREAARTSVELGARGLQNQMLAINGVFHTTQGDDPVALALERKGQQALDDMPAPLRDLPHTHVSLRGHNIIGAAALRDLLIEPPPAPHVQIVPAAEPLPTLPPLATLVDEIAARDTGLVMVMGKGGVGKTTIAAAIATALAARGFSVHLTTTDPAAHLALTLDSEVPGLRVSRIDPKAEAQAYQQRALTQAKQRLDAEGLAFFAEDLQSPCTEEVAVFHAFSRLVSGAKRELVIMDTAPTGHTLLLLDATGAYHREVMRKFASRVIATPLMRLRDPAYTKVLLVTLPEPTPVQEAAQLQADLWRADIEPYAWVINSSLAAAGPRDPILRQRAAAELEQIQYVQEHCARRVVIVPWALEEPIGPQRLRRLVQEPVEHPFQAAMQLTR